MRQRRVPRAPEPSRPRRWGSVSAGPPHRIAPACAGAVRSISVTTRSGAKRHCLVTPIPPIAPARRSERSEGMIQSFRRQQATNNSLGIHRSSLRVDAGAPNRSPRFKTTPAKHSAERRQGRHHHRFTGIYHKHPGSARGIRSAPHGRDKPSALARLTGAKGCGLLRPCLRAQTPGTLPSLGQRREPLGRLG